MSVKPMQFAVIPLLPSSNPTQDNHATRKKWVADQLAATLSSAQGYADSKKAEAIAAAALDATTKADAAQAAAIAAAAADATGKAATAKAEAIAAAAADATTKANNAKAEAIATAALDATAKADAALDAAESYADQKKSEAIAAAAADASQKANAAKAEAISAAALDATAKADAAEADAIAAAALDATSKANAAQAAAIAAAALDATSKANAAQAAAESYADAKKAEAIAAAAADATSKANAAEVAAKLYADNLAAGLDVKESVKVATTGPIMLNGTQTVDGVMLMAGDRVLVKNQAMAQDNGIYVVAASGWSRAVDADQGDLDPGAFTIVEEGAVNGDQMFVLTSNGPITVGSSPINWTRFAPGKAIQAGNGIQETTVGNVQTFAVLPKSGGGIQVDAMGVALKLDTVMGSGLVVGADGLKIMPGASSGLEVGMDGVKVKRSAAGGIEIGPDGGLKLDLAAMPGLQLAADGLKLQIGTGEPLSIGAMGLQLDLQAGRGLTEAGGLGIAEAGVLAGMLKGRYYTAAHSAAVTPDMDGFYVVDVAHNTGYQFGVLLVVDQASGEVVHPAVEWTSANSLKLGFLSAVSANQYRIAFFGLA